MELEDVRAFWKTVITPVDENPLDLRMAFIAYTVPLAGGEFKIRVGRQQMAFDLQRFVSIRDGPNVQQAFDAVWLDWERDAWRIIAFWSQPVQYRHAHPFDDFSSQDFQYGGLRVERKNVGPGDLSAYYSRFQMNNAKYLDASGDERRSSFDVRYAGESSGFDWDLEFMGQTGYVGSKRIWAWAFGSRSGYTLDGIRWTPRLGLQIDAALGDQHPEGRFARHLQPVVPERLLLHAGGIHGLRLNLIHVKPSLTLRPVGPLTLMGAVGLQGGAKRRRTPSMSSRAIRWAARPGCPGQWTGAYVQVRADWAITPESRRCHRGRELPGRR